MAEQKRSCENCGNARCANSVVAIYWDECVNSNFEKHWMPREKQVIDFDKVCKQIRVLNGGFEMTVSDSFADSWTLDDWLRILHFQIEAYRHCKQQDHSSLMAFNLEAIDIECDRIRTIIREIKRDGGIIDG